MWRQCGAGIPGLAGWARLNGPAGGAKSAPFHSLQNGENFASWLVDNSVTPRLYSPHNGAPVGFGAMARLRSTSLIVVTGHPNVLRMSWASAALRFFRRGGSLGSPGCLTTESEERETWTAESLRAASLQTSNRMQRRGRTRLRRYTFRSTPIVGELASQEAIAQAMTCWTSSKSRRASVVTRRTCDQPRSKSQSNLRV